MIVKWSKKDLEALAYIAKNGCQIESTCDGCRFDSPYAGCLLIVNRTGRPSVIAKEILETALKEIIETE